MRFYGIVFVVTFFASASAGAIPLEELKKYDLNRNNCIDPGREESLLIKHLENPVLRRFDHFPMDGVINGVEAEKISRATGDDLKMSAAFSENQIDEFRLDLTARRCFFTDLADKPEAGAKKAKDEQRLFLRKDRLDISIYNKSIDQSAAEGASISFSSDFKNDQRSLGFEGYLTYVVARDRAVLPPDGIQPKQGYLSGYAIAPYLQFNRVTTGGRNAPDETDLLSFGTAAQFEYFSGPIFSNQVVTISPYIQTDSHGSSQIYAGRATWEPYNTSWGIGLGERRPLVSGIDYTWQFHGDVDYRFVESAGFTGLQTGDQYFWTGAGARFTFWVLPELFESKLYAVVSPSYYYNLTKSQNAALLGSTFRGPGAGYVDASLNYNLDKTGISSLKVAYKRGYDIQLNKDFNIVTGSVGVKF